VWFTTRGPWPVKSRLAVLRKGPGHPQPKLRLRRLLRGVRGSTEPAIVLAFRFDCRSWQAARGQGDHGLIARHHRLDLAPPARAERGAKERRKPACGGKAVGTVAGSLRESGKGALVDGRRLGSGKLLALTRGRWKRFWRFVSAQQWVLAGRDRGRQRPAHRPWARLRTPRQGSPACARGSSPPLFDEGRDRR